jgi:hypothetical protein
MGERFRGQPTVAQTVHPTEVHTNVSGSIGAAPRRRVANLLPSVNSAIGLSGSSNTRVVILKPSGIGILFLANAVGVIYLLTYSIRLAVGLDIPTIDLYYLLFLNSSF